MSLAASTIQSLPEFVYRHLRSRIADGNYPAGAPLRQEEIARSLNVSRVPVREALTRLEAEGLVVLRPRRGYAVVALAPENIDELTAICVRLEELAAAEAAKRRTPDDVAALEAILALMIGAEANARAGEAEALSAWSMHHRAFHDRLFATSGRKTLCRMIALVRDQLEPFIRIEVAMSNYLDLAEEEHRRLLDLFRAGKADELGRLAAEHIQKSGERLLRLITDRQRMTGRPPD